jgi:hypothetical protein
MATHTVTKVRMEWSGQGGRHEHIEGVCTTANVHHTRKAVVDSINAGNTWQTSADGKSARIRPIQSCKHPGCMATPYITTGADATPKNNLDNLPRC